MNSKFYKCCAVPECKNTTIKTPKKLFIHVPRMENSRKKWLLLARRDPGLVSTQSKMYFCEDHFDLPNDMDNYSEYHLMGSVSQIRMKTGCFPTKFGCQADKIRQTNMNTSRSLPVKRQRLEQTAVYEREIAQAQLIQTFSVAEVRADPSSDIPEPMCETTPMDVLKQVSVYPKCKSKMSQTQTKCKNIEISSNKNQTTTVSIAPLKLGKSYPFEDCKTFKKLHCSKEELSDNAISLCTLSLVHTNSSSSILFSQQTKASLENSSPNEQRIKLEAEHIVQNAIDKINKNPRLYIGVPEKCYYLIKVISNHTNIPFKHILLCLKKIRLDTTFSELADEFGVSVSYASELFLENIPTICSAMRPFIVNLENNTIKQSLPLAFRFKYNHASCIIDCFKIIIQKSSDVNQALAYKYSNIALDYKKENTLKYLISCTPDGLVNYVSPGYEGSTSDAYVLENCSFLNILEKGSRIMTNRGFEHIDQMVIQAGLQLHIPSSVCMGSKLSKPEACQTEKNSSLRIHIEKVIERLQEFAMLKPNAYVNSDLVRVLDEVVIIMCALVNLQNSVIK